MLITRHRMPQQYPAGNTSKRSCDREMPRCVSHSSLKGLMKTGVLADTHARPAPSSLGCFGRMRPDSEFYLLARTVANIKAARYPSLHSTTATRTHCFATQLAFQSTSFFSLIPSA